VNKAVLLSQIPLFADQGPECAIAKFPQFYARPEAPTAERH